MRRARALSIPGSVLAAALAVATLASPAAAQATTEPDGRIRYLSGIGTQQFGDLFDVRPDRTGRRLLIADLYGRLPSAEAGYSADLSTVVYTASDRSVWRVRADGTGRQQIAPAWDYDADPTCERICGLSTPRFSPEGTRVASVEPAYLGAPARVVVLGTDGSGVRIIPVSDEWDSMTPQGALSWSPDGTRVAYAMGRAESERAAIHITDLRTGTTQRLTDLNAWRSDAAWSPDGRSIAYSGTAQLPSGVSGYEVNRDLYTIRVDSHAVRRVTTTANRMEYRPAWSPDSGWLAYDRRPPDDFSVKPSVRRITANGTDERPLDVNGYVYGWVR
ncbi:MAG TPA: hypothetical protein VK453_00930 [Micromonosporaceae bacterium]|nr:hypothetical protein [Micromonosporaceae bacterium]